MNVTRLLGLKTHAVNTIRNFTKSAPTPKALKNWSRPSIDELTVPRDPWKHVFDRNQKKLRLFLPRPHSKCSFPRWPFWNEPTSIVSQTFNLGSKVASPPPPLFYIKFKHFVFSSLSKSNVFLSLKKSKCFLKFVMVILTF